MIAGLAAGCFGAWAGPAAAAAPRRLTLIRQETDEVADNATFWRDGRPDDEGIARLDWLLRDVRAGKVTPIHHRVYRLLELVQADFGGRPIVVTSGFRTQATNEWLRRHGYPAVRNSFHIRAQAVDLKMEGVDPSWIAAVGERLRFGGVGLYPRFVHLDIGPIRRWYG